MMKYLVRSALFKLFSRRFDRLSPLAALLATVALGLIAICHGAVAQTAQSSTTRYEYDANGNLIRIIDPLGRVTVQRYDTSNRLVQQQLPSPVAGAPQPVIAYSYDAKNQITGVTDPRNLPTQYTVDGLGNQTVLASPDSGVTTRTFDAAGNHASTKDARGQLTTIDHDALGRITRIAYASGTPSTFEYDSGSAGAIGRLSKMTDESGQTSYIYDNAGRLVSKNVAIGTGGKQKLFTVGYAYGSSGPSNGKVIDIAYPSGNHVFIYYGEEGQASSMSLLKAGATTPVVLVSEIQYHPSGAVQSWTWGNSTAAVPNRYFREFDLRGRITRFPLGNILKGGVVRTITYDAAGRITDHVGTGLPGDLAPRLNQSYGYDDLDRLTNFAGNNTTARYQYDASGNRTQLAYGGQTFLNTINPASNQLQKTTGPLPIRTNSYDAAGNLTTDGAINYIYNARGRLQSAQSGTITGTYRHNGLDQRAIKMVKIGSAANSLDETTHFIYDELGQLIGEYDPNGTLIEETIYFGNLPIAIHTRGKISESADSDIYYIYNDQIKTPRVITDSRDNHIVWRWDLAEPFGVSSPDDVPQGLGKFSYNIRFPGQYFYRETNLHYNYHRDYDPQTGRYTESDPIGLRAGINTYTYVSDDPVNGADPLGLEGPNTGWRGSVTDAAPYGSVRPDVRVYLCQKIQECGGDTNCLYNRINRERLGAAPGQPANPKTWNDPVLRDAENFAAAASPDAMPFSSVTATPAGIGLYQYVIKPGLYTMVGKATTPVSNDAYLAGLLGQHWQGLIPAQVMAESQQMCGCAR